MERRLTPIGEKWETISPYRNKFSLGSTDIILVGPYESNDVQQFLGKYGERPIAIGLRTNDKTRLSEINLSLAGETGIHLMQGD